MENESVTILASAVRTADENVELRNHRFRGILIVVDVTLDAAAAAVTPKIMVKDENGDFNGAFWAATAAIAAVGTFTYLICPGVIAADFDGTEAVGLALPLEWELWMDHADDDAITYSVRGHYLS